MIDTTINIKSDLLTRITKATADHGISLNRIIAVLIYKSLKNCSIKIKLFNTVKYQETGDDIIWHTLHVSFTEDIYEKALDMRKVLKMSVSFIIARAIEVYLNDVIRELSDKTDTDNYIQEYVCISNKYNGFLNFSIFWSNQPDKIIKKYTNYHSESVVYKLS